MEDVKPKRILSPETLEKLKFARVKAAEAKKQNKLITNYEKEEKRNIKHSKREETYKTILEIIKKLIKEEPKPIPEPVRKQAPKARPRPQPEPEPEYETETESEEEPLPPPAPKPKQRQPQQRPKEYVDAKLYSNASAEILRRQLYEQTNKRLMNDLFSY